MRFAELLCANLTPEWRKQYVAYEMLKSLIYTVKDSIPPDLQDRETVLAKGVEKFLKSCDDQLKKVDLFYTQKLAEAERRYRELENELRSLQTRTELPEKKTTVRSRFPVPQATVVSGKLTGASLRRMKLAYSEFYLNLVMIQQFQQLNSTGFRKILKKFDKVLGVTRGLEWRQAKVENSAFYLNKDADQLITKTENLVTGELEGGDRQTAMKRLRVPPLSEIQSPWTTFKLGLFIGTFVVLSGIIGLSVVFHKNPTEPRWVGVRLFRGFLILFLNVFLLGINMYGWQSSGVNHVLIFELDPRDHLTYQGIMEISAMWCCIWAVAVLSYMYAGVAGIPPLAMPLALALLLFVWLFNPFPFGQRSSRRWFLQRMYVCLTAPFHPVSFPDFWLADQMNSLVTAFLDVEYFCCFYGSNVNWTGGLTLRTNLNGTEWAVGVTLETGADRCTTNQYGIRPLITIIPALSRFLQCCRRYRDSHAANPHLLNAGKYSTTFLVVALGAFNKWAHRSGFEHSIIFYFWVFAYLLSTTYTFVWDVRMDWGFFDPKPGPNPFLREELVYNHRWFYYAAVLQDGVLRLAWTLNITLNHLWTDYGDALVCVTALLECFRRCVWNFFRLENEHLNNCGNFRAVRDISIKPIAKGDLDVLVKMIDEADGVSHRGYNSRRQKNPKKPGKKVRPNLMSRRGSLSVLSATTLSSSTSIPSSGSFSTSRRFSLHVPSGPSAFRPFQPLRHLLIHKS